ncbi:Hypothetical_protein [Hexamita inflata]|uniref:Hypothetical_protein n=1 Tax=Hexamita inflata TaxID=28002 RepID=A0AA86UQZ9_9EUKA|nr:Hypothetical protein HINF_LOCUS52244 [Hexamita inflata]
MNNSSLVGGLDCISISSDSQISIMDILNEQLFQNKAESLPNSSKTQQLPKKLNSNNQVSKLEYSVEQIKSLINTRAFTGYSIVDAKQAEKQLSVILFASKAKARDVLHAKTTLRNTRSSPDSYCCCYYQKHKRYRILQQIQEEREAILKLKKYEQLDSIFGVDQEINQPKTKKAEGKQDPNTPCKKTRRSFKNKCSKACAIVLIKGNTLIKTKSRYIDRFHYVVDDGDKVGSYNTIKKDEIYYYIQFNEGFHDDGKRRCIFKRNPTRCRFTESQKQILTTFQQEHAYDTFDGFWKLNSTRFTQTKQQVMTKLRNMYHIFDLDQQLQDYSQKFNLNYEYKCDSTTAYQHHFGFCNENAKQYFNHFKHHFKLSKIII